MASIREIRVDRRSLLHDPDDDLAVSASTDAEAFGLLYERHRLPVFRYLRARTGNDEDAGELTAVVFERALRAMPRYRPGRAGFLAWLLRIARNAAIDWHRRVRPSMGLDETFVSGAWADPETHALARERRMVLAKAVDALSPIEREAIALRFASGLTARQIGTVIGKSDQATQKLISRALAAVREACDVE